MFYFSTIIISYLQTAAAVGPVRWKIRARKAQPPAAHLHA
jgi:hypothetical protein